MKLVELMESINLHPAVREAQITRAAAQVPGFGSLHSAQIEWYYSVGGVSKVASGEVLITALGDPENESVEWMEQVPPLFRPAATGTYISARTVNGWGALSPAAQETAIHAFLSDAWRTAQTNEDLDDIRELQLRPVGPNTLRAQGSFHLGFTWTEKTYYVHLTDANGSISPASGNVVFEQVV